MKIELTESPKRVVVVGGGPGGLEAAWVAAARGHRVVLLEQECTAQRVYKEIKDLLNDSRRSGFMSENLRKLAVSDSADRICRIAENLAAQKK